MSLPVVTAIYDKLASVTTAGSFHAAVSGQYYHLETPENTTPPLCVYAADQPAPLNMRYDGSELEVWRFRFVVFVLNNDPTPDATAFGIDTKLRTLLHGSRLTATGYDRLTVLCESNGIATKDEEAVRVESVYRVFGTKTT